MFFPRGERQALYGATGASEPTILQLTLTSPIVQATFQQVRTDLQFIHNNVTIKALEWKNNIKKHSNTECQLKMFQKIGLHYVTIRATKVMGNILSIRYE